MKHSIFDTVMILLTAIGIMIMISYKRAVTVANNMAQTQYAAANLECFKFCIKSDKKILLFEHNAFRNRSSCKCEP